MSKARFTSNRTVFNSKNREFKELATQRMAADIERLIKTGGKIPRKDGELQSSISHEPLKTGSFTTGYRVKADSDHAAVQELGKRRGAREFKNYTTPGTGKGWFKGAIITIESKKDQYIQQAKRSAKL